MDNFQNCCQFETGTLDSLSWQNQSLRATHIIVPLFSQGCRHCPNTYLEDFCDVKGIQTLRVTDNVSPRRRLCLSSKHVCLCDIAHITECVGDARDTACCCLQESLNQGWQRSGVWVCSSVLPWRFQPYFPMRRQTLASVPHNRIHNCGQLMECISRPDWPTLLTMKSCCLAKITIMWRIIRIILPPLHYNSDHR